jgi:hypothetical protein
MNKNKIFILTLFGFISMGWGQTKPTESKLKIIQATDIPIDTIATQEDNTISIAQTVLVDTIAVKPVITNISTDSVTINLSDIPTFNLKDNPELAQIDSLWMELVKKSELFDVSSIKTDIPSENLVIEELPSDL